MDKTSFIDYDTQKQINAPLNGTLIHGTHRMCDLIPAMLEAIRDTAEYAQLSSRLPSVVTDPGASEWDDRWEDEDIAYLHEELTDILERYAPEGYYFGAHPGDGSDFGYWRDESYMLQVISESVKEGQTLVLAEDPAITYRPSHPSEPSIINAYQLARRKEGVMVGNKTHMVNINDLDEDSIQILFEAVKDTKAKSITAKDAVKELLPNSGIDFIQNSGTTYDINMQEAVAKVSGVNVRNDDVFLYGIIKKDDGGIQHLNYLEDLPVPAQNQLVQHVKDTLAKINSPEQSKASTLTPIEKEVIGSIVRGHGNIPGKMEGEEYEEFYGEVLGAEMLAMTRQQLSDRQREILQEEIKHYKNGVEELAKSLHCHPDHIKAALGDKEAIKGLITSTIDNMQFISEVIDRYEKYAPALESFDKIETKEDIAAWLKQVDKMVGKDIDDPLRQAATSLMRLNEAQYPTFLACMEEYRKDPMLLSSVYFDKVVGGEVQHAKIDDVLLRANELGIEYHPFVISGGIGVDNFDDGVDITSKEFKYASVEKDDIIVYEKEQDLFGFNSGYSISDLPEEAQNAVLDQIFDDLFAVNDPLLIVYDRKEVPAYALSAVVNGDFSGIDDPEDEQNIRDFMEKNKGYIFSIDSESRGFSDNPAFGLPTDCETVFMVKTVSPKELLEQQKAGKQETVEEAPVTLEGDRLEVGMKVIWNDPESQYRAPDRIYTIDKINGEVISISDEHSEVEVGASELSVATQKQDVDQDKFLNYVIHGDRRYPIYQTLEARLNAFMKAFKVDIPLSSTLYSAETRSGRWSDLHQTVSRAIESILRASGNGDEKLMNSTNADYVSDKAKNLAKGMMRAIYSDEENYEIRREEALKTIGYPYKHGLGADGSFDIPTVDKSLYWDYAAGLITVKDAAREFCRCGWTNFVDEKYTLKKFGEINKQFGKLDADLKPMVNQTKAEDLSNVRFPEAYLRSFAVRLFGDNVAMNLRSYPEVNRVRLGYVPDTITIDGIEIKDGELKLMSDNLGGEIEQSALHWVDVEVISAMLKEAYAAYEKTQKAGETEDKRPLIKVVYDESLSNYRGRDLYLGDNGRYFTRQPEDALSYDDNGKVIKDNWKWVICTDNYQLEPDYPYDKYARFEIVDSLDEKKEEELSEAKGKSTVKKAPDITVGIRESLEALIRRMMPEPDGTITLPKLYDGESPEQGRVRGTFHYVNGEIFLSISGREDALKDMDGFNELTEPYRLLLEKDITNMLGKDGHIDFAPGTFIDGAYEISSIVVKDGQARPTGKRDGSQANSFDYISYVGLDELDTAVRAELREAKGNLRSVLDDTKADLGNAYKISPLDIDMGNWKAHVDTIEYNPESDLDYYVASGIDKDGGHSNVQIHKLENMSSVSELTKAVREVFVGYHEQKAMHAIHDRITNTWQRSFTPDQVEALNRYHQVAAPDTPAGEVFKELLKEVAQEPDVARKPEKWVTDTAKELDGLADGITREETRGLHK